MSELNLWCHYQMVKYNYGGTEEFCVHEAFSFEKGGLYMLNPVPVYVAGETIEDVMDIASALEKKEIEKHGVVDAEDAQRFFDRYVEETTIHVTVEPDYRDDVEPEDDEPAYRDRGNVIDLVDFFKRNK